MNVLVLSNMAPSKQAPNAGIFVQNQVDILSQSDAIAHLKFIAIRSTKKGLIALLAKYGLLLWHVLSQAVFSRVRYDVVHVHYYYPTIWFAIVYKLLRNRKCKIVVTFHGSDIYSYEPAPALYRLAARFIDKAIFVSDGLRQNFFKTVDDSVTLSAGILPSFTAQSLEKQYDLLMVGSVNQNKGFDRLEQILRQFDKPLRVLVIGDGPYAERLKQWQFEQHQLAYLRTQSPAGLIEKYNQSRFLLSLSHNEAFGLVMTEAMACATPVLATATDGAKAQVVDGVNGFLIDIEGDVIASACEVIDKALFALEPEQYHRIHQGAVAAAKLHMLPHISEQLLKHYQAVLAKDS